MINSLNRKIALIFILLGLFLLFILFIQIVPKMQKEQEKYAKKQIDNMIYLTTQQLKLATKALREQSESKREYKKSIIESKVENIENKLHIDKVLTKSYIDEISKELTCDIHILDTDDDILLKTNDNIPDLSELRLNDWTTIYDVKREIVCPNPPKGIYFTKKIKEEDHTIVFSCTPKTFNSKSMEFEFKLKKDIQSSFSLFDDIHKGKVYLMWVNEERLKDSKEPIYDKKDDYYFNSKYCISQTSNLRYPRTGDLTGEKLIGAIDKEPVKHLLDSDENRGVLDKKAVTWVRSLNDNPKRRLLFITTVFEEDFDNKIDSSFWNILPATLFSLLLAIALGFFLFRRVFKSINLLSDTAQMVNKGDISIRSNIRGEDDIGVLGITFDNMLNSIEKNIQELDNKVELRTKELKSSLDEKETLLKEIHHRVKNNLAMTIELIKIQKAKLKDRNTKEALGDIQERIYTMELLHRKLYESKNLSSIDIKKYITELLEELHHTFENEKNIKVDVDIEDTYFMDIEYALPCGLIINESVTNSFKHAFDENGGNICISLKKIEYQFILKIEDNGKGISQEIDIKKTKTLGLKLISNIVRGQLLGELEYSNDKGTMFTIVFECK